MLPNWNTRYEGIADTGFNQPQEWLNLAWKCALRRAAGKQRAGEHMPRLHREFQGMSRLRQATDGLNSGQASTKRPKHCYQSCTLTHALQVLQFLPMCGLPDHPENGGIAHSSPSHSISSPQHPYPAPGRAAHAPPVNGHSHHASGPEIQSSVGKASRWSRP